jgi:uncharacterized membrane protein YgdD (TMEM256/DUF423 family)
MHSTFGRTAAWLGFLGVVLGAFGAHALKARLTADDLAIFDTAVRYQLGHVLALLCVALLARTSDSAWLRRAGIAFVLGIAIFSGSLYVLVLANLRWMGAITPIGGVALLLGWAFLALSFAKRRAPGERLDP